MKIEELVDQYKEILLLLAKDGDRGKFHTRPDLTYRELSDIPSNKRWRDFKYVLQRLDGRDYHKISSLNQPGSHSFESAFIYSLDILFDDLVPMLCYSDADKKKNLDYYLIFFRIAQVGAKMINKERGYDSYLSENNTSIDKEHFSTELCFIYLSILFSEVYIQRSSKWVYETLSNVISKIELRIIEQKANKFYDRTLASKEISLSLYKSIVLKIERDIQLYGKSNTFKKKWGPIEFTDYELTSENKLEIFIDFFSTGDIKDTKEAISKYLTHKASNSNYKWIASLLESTPKNSASIKAEYKYHPFLSAFFYECKANGIIAPTITPTQFKNYLDTEYSNKLSSLKAFNQKHGTQKKEPFEDLKMWLKKYRPGKQRN